MRVALVHDWLTGMRGGERVLEELIGIFPSAELFTLVHVPGTVSPLIEARPSHTSWLNALPGVARWYRFALPLFPGAIERFDLRGFDLLISSSHCVAKGVRAPAGVPHVCYCHTPMRYLYDQSDSYARRFSPLVRTAFSLAQGRLRRWDQMSTPRVTHFIANSEYVRQRIARVYGRTAAVVHPPVSVERFRAQATRDDFYVTVSALVPYKRVDLVVEAFNLLGRKLIVVGSGPERVRLQGTARSNISFTGWISDDEVAELLGRARGFVFAGTEDFGIALAEAQAAGAPVIAFAEGGAAEIVDDGRTGVLFTSQDARAVIEGIERAEQVRFDAAALQRQAQRFSAENFRAQLRAEIERVLPGAVPAAAGMH